MSCIPTFTKREWLLLIALVAVTFASALCASLQAPFYPHEAEKKGASATEYGLVFGIFELVSFISCPILGKYMGFLGAGFVLKCGILMTGSSTVAFGLLDLIGDHWWFIGLSFCVRSVEAVGVSAIVTASMSIVVVVFEDSFARVFTALEILQGLGYMVGPTIGGYLFEIGGFILPFAVVGVFVLACGVFIVCSLPDVDQGDNKGKTQTHLMSVLKVLPVLLDASCLMVEAMSIGFLAATLEPHLRQFLLSPTALGAMFVISGVVYTFVAPLVGILCDKNFNTKKMIMFGSLLTIFSFMLIGPMPFTPFNTSLWVVGVGLVFDGLGMSFMFVPAFVDAIHSAIKYGHPDDINTYAIVSGIYGSSFALGAFIGPSAAGMLYDAVGFREGSLFIVAVHTALFISVLWFVCVEKGYEQQHMIVCDASSPDDAPASEDAHTLTLEGAEASAQVAPRMTNGYSLVIKGKMADAPVLIR